MPRLLLIGWDAADWRLLRPLIEAGEMPMLKRLMESGFAGNLRTLEPVLSPLLWTSIATGKRAPEHGVLGFTEVDPLRQEVRPVSAASRKCAAVWNILAAHGYACHVIGWFATQGEALPGGSMVSNFFPAPTAKPGEPWPTAPRGTVFPESDAEALNALRVSPEQINAEIVSLFCPRFREIDTTRDPLLNHLRIHLAETFSIHAAACWTLRNRPGDFFGVYFRALDEIAHHFMPFHPPQMPGVPGREFALYSEVMRATCRLHDRMLAQLIALAPEDTHVLLVSDHGFHCDQHRPKFTPRVPAGITVWHRKQGIIAGSGPLFRKSAEIQRAGLLDLTPTILHLFGLPAAKDMPGGVLESAFLPDHPPLPRIPTHEGPKTAPQLQEIEFSASEKTLLMEQFVALGYLEKPGESKELNAEATERENQWSLARAHLDAGQFLKALPILEDLYFDLPERTDFAQMLAFCQTRIGLNEEAEAVLDAVMETASNQGIAALFLAQSANQRKDFTGALKHLQTAAAAGLEEDTRYLQERATALFYLGRSAEAQALCHRLIELDPDRSLAHFGVAYGYWKSGQFSAALESVERALALHSQFPIAHLLRSRILWKLGREQESEAALRETLSVAPQFPDAIRRLGALCRLRGWHLEAEQCLDFLGQVRRVLKNRAEDLEELRKSVRQRARARHQRRSAAKDTAPNQPAGEKKVCDIIIVSGLPRSGTSLMMQLLQAGGINILTDHQRPPDEHNPLGYLEWNAIRGLPRDPDLIQAADGKAVKVVSPLLNHLPRHHRYHILFMRRPIKDIARSQHRMRYGVLPDEDSCEESIQMLSKHLDQTLETLGGMANQHILMVEYSELLRNPSNCIHTLVRFLRGKFTLHPENMTEVIRPELNHGRSRG